MKKVFLLVIAFMSFSIIVNSQSVESLRKDIEKSNQKIADAKKSAKTSTWEDRGELFIEAFQFNTKTAFVGMPKTGSIQAADVLVGKPKNKTTKDGKEIWNYDNIDLVFENDVVAKIVETNPVTPNALEDAYKAYQKGSELDAKFNSKSSVMKSMAKLRDFYLNRGIELYQDNKYADGLKDVEKSLEIYAWPREKNDTTFKVSAVNYYAGVIAQNAKENAKAKKYFSESLKGKYETAKCYHFLSEISKAENDTLGSLKILQEGYEKNPESNDILIDLINFYLLKGESKEATVYLDKAIAKDPKNPSLYFAKATLFDKVANDPKTKDADREQNFNAAAEIYKKAIEVDANYYNAYYNLGALYYNKAAKIIEAAQKIPPKETKLYDAEMEKANEQFKAAMPYMEKAHQMDAKDKSTLQTLSTIYMKLQMYDKQKEAKAKLEQLGN